MSILRKAGTTDVSVTIRIIDSTDGTPEEAVEHNTSGIALWYRREGAAKAAITPAALSALTDAHSDGGIEHVDDGYYRLDLPDAACASGATGVLIGGTVTGMVIIGEYVQLVAYDPFDGVRAGLTALPNAAADTAGGLPISDAGGLDLDAKLANTNEVTAARMGALTDWIDGGRLDLLIDAIKAKTDGLPTDPADASDVAAAIAALNDLSAAQVNAEVVDALATDTYAEITGVPGYPAAITTMIRRLYATLINPLDQTASKKTFKNAAGTAQWEKDVSDDSTTYSESAGNAP